jgi:hypothetical protein
MNSSDAIHHHAGLKEIMLEAMRTGVPATLKAEAR